MNFFYIPLELEQFLLDVSGTFRTVPDTLDDSYNKTTTVNLDNDIPGELTVTVSYKPIGLEHVIDVDVLIDYVNQSSNDEKKQIKQGVSHELQQILRNSFPGELMKKEDNQDKLSFRHKITV